MGDLTSLRAMFAHTYNAWTGMCQCGEGPMGQHAHQHHLDRLTTLYREQATVWEDVLDE